MRWDVRSSAFSDWCAADHFNRIKEQSALLIADTLPTRAFTPPAVQRTRAHTLFKKRAKVIHIASGKLIPIYNRIFFLGSYISLTLLNRK